MRPHNIVYRRGSYFKARSRFYHCLGTCDAKGVGVTGFRTLELGHHMKVEGRRSGRTRCPSVVKTETLVLMYLFKR